MIVTSAATMLNDCYVCCNRSQSLDILMV